jgi:hypothetical protein
MVYAPVALEIVDAEIIAEDEYDVGRWCCRDFVRSKTCQFEKDGEARDQ